MKTIITATIPIIYLISLYYFIISNATITMLILKKEKRKYKLILFIFITHAHSFFLSYVMSIF